ncbi:9933_t:CDS:1 [Paraglomus brasilianum]|uniref:9933_t:CDS:1 n=1 Tax=Paraglomus brasilianum TaxID=144538 RepID=A0A9N9DPR4_9GLOM|nr:9933_t:CDS:1 [Paraglomus brasilianum]
MAASDWSIFGTLSVSTKQTTNEHYSRSFTDPTSPAESLFSSSSKQKDPAQSQPSTTNFNSTAINNMVRQFWISYIAIWTVDAIIVRTYGKQKSPQRSTSY